MNITLIRRSTLAAVVTGSMISCGTKPPSGGGRQLAIPDLQAITDSDSGAGAGAGAGGKDWHTEDVIVFRKGPSGRFSVDIP